MKRFLSWLALVCIGVALLVLVKFEVSDQLDRQYYEKQVATHMLPIANESQPMAARALVDQDEVFGQGLEQHPKLAIEVRHYTVAPGQELHVKMCIIDDKTLGMGSTNFSSGAFQSNYELFAFIEGPRIVGDFSAMFETDWKTRSEPPPKLNLGRKIISVFSDVIF
jgi:phosphatidylserine/phosphatidylglycerophosphate/cardiolipin synthase-like enzyme